MSSSLEQRIEELRGDRTHGGSWLARRAVEALLAEAEACGAQSADELLEHLTAVARRLAASRPAMGAIAGAVGRVLAAAHSASHLPPEELKRLVDEEGRGLIAARDRAAASIAIHLAPMLADALVLTHSASATVREAVIHTRPARVCCTVSAPFEEGRAFAEDLRAQGLDVALVEDADAVRELEASSLFLVGADTVFRDGVICNKIGTAQLAEAASELGVRTVVACELIKLAPVGAPPSPAEADVFDNTPAEHVDEVVTEEGIIPSEELPALIDRTPFLRQGYALLRG
jgi:translation initiation factor 2B subunit (eIF-2B alpha/beta/delta family)